MKGLRVVRTSLAVAFLTTVLFAVPGCLRVSDRLTGVDAEFHHGPSPCIRECNEQFFRDLAIATKTLIAKLAECKQLPEAERNPCYKAAWSEYEAKVIELERARRNCIGSCHHQGSGSAQ